MAVISISYFKLELEGGENSRWDVAATMQQLTDFIDINT
jgi:hypothetical protein